MLFVITLCWQTGVSYAGEPKAQQSRSFKDSFCGLVCKESGFDAFCLEKQHRQPASRSHLLLNMQITQYLNNAKAYIEAQPSDQAPLSTARTRRKYENLSNKIHYALHGQEKITPALMKQVKACMTQNSNPIYQSVLPKWDFANRRYVRDAQKFLDSRLFVLRGQELIREIDIDKSSMQVAQEVDDFLVFAYNRELLVEPTNGFGKTSGQLYTDFDDLVRSQKIVAESLMREKTALKPQHLDKHI